MVKLIVNSYEMDNIFQNCQITEFIDVVIADIQNR